MLQSSVKNVFIRGSVVRYVHLPPNAVDIPLLEDATRRGKLFQTRNSHLFDDLLTLLFSRGCCAASKSKMRLWRAESNFLLLQKKFKK